MTFNLLQPSKINEPSLSPLWSRENSALVAAATVKAITSYDRSAAIGGMSSAVLERYSAVLKALKASDAAVYDRAVAYAVNAASNRDDEGGRTRRLAELLGRDSAKSSGRKGEGPAEETETAERGLVVGLLPPRVVLKGANAEVRLDAVARLKSAMGGGEDADEDLGRALLRRLASDDDARVAGAAGEVVSKELRKLAVRGGLSAFAPLADDPSGPAAEAIALIACWTLVAKDGDSWSPATVLVTPSKKKKKGEEEAKAGEGESSPLHSCISLCRSVMRLIAEEHCKMKTSVHWTYARILIFIS